MVGKTGRAIIESFKQLGRMVRDVVWKSPSGENHQVNTQAEKNIPSPIQRTNYSHETGETGVSVSVSEKGIWTKAVKKGDPKHGFLAMQREAKDSKQVKQVKQSKKSAQESEKPTTQLTLKASSPSPKAKLPNPKKTLPADSGSEELIPEIKAEKPIAELPEKAEEKSAEEAYTAADSKKWLDNPKRTDPATEQVWHTQQTSQLQSYARIKNNNDTKQILERVDLTGEESIDDQLLGSIYQPLFDSNLEFEKSVDSLSVGSEAQNRAAYQRTEDQLKNKVKVKTGRNESLFHNRMSMIQAYSKQIENQKTEDYNKLSADEKKALEVEKKKAEKADHAKRSEEAKAAAEIAKPKNPEKTPDEMKVYDDQKDDESFLDALDRKGTEQYEEQLRLDAEAKTENNTISGKGYKPKARGSSKNEPVKQSEDE